MTARSAPKGHLTVKRVAQLCCRTPGTIYRWLDEGAVEELRIGRARYVNADSLVSYLGDEVSLAIGLLLDDWPTA